MLMDDILRLHTDADNNVWIGCNGYLAINTRLQPEAFVRERAFLHAQKVRVIGCRQNAKLIVEVFRRRLDERLVGQHVTIGSPEICLSHRRLDNPEFVLQRIWQPNSRARTASSWHTMGNGDYTTYLLCSIMPVGGNEPGDIVRRTFQYHPAWAACSFVPTYDEQSMAKLVCEIIDPRWYNHPERPHRSSKLMSYLGLNPANMAEVWGGHVVGTKQTRAKLVAESWFGEYRGEDLNEPSNFLWRIFRHHGAEAKGLLAASRVFVQFVKLFWLQHLLPSRHIFDAEVFFKHECEVEAFRSHLEQVAN